MPEDDPPLLPPEKDDAGLPEDDPPLLPPENAEPGLLVVPLPLPPEKEGDFDWAGGLLKEVRPLLPPENDVRPDPPLLPLLPPENDERPPPELLEPPLLLPPPPLPPWASALPNPMSMAARASVQIRFMSIVQSLPFAGVDSPLVVLESSLR